MCVSIDPHWVIVGRFDWLIRFVVENSCPDRFRSFVRCMNKTRKNMQKLTPFLWFNDRAEDAVNNSWER